MLHFEGTKDVPRPPAEVWASLSDARFVIECVPGVESIAHSDPGQVTCTLRPGFAFVRGTLELTLQVVKSVPDSSAQFLLRTKGIGTTSEVEANWSVEPQVNGTHLLWSADVKSLGGLLKAVPQGLVKASAQKVIADALASIEQKLAEGM